MISAEITKEEEDQEHKKIKKKYPKKLRITTEKRQPQLQETCGRPVKGQLGYNLPSHPTSHSVARREACQPPGQSIRVVREQNLERLMLGLRKRFSKDEHKLL